MGRSGPTPALMPFSHNGDLKRYFQNDFQSRQQGCFMSNDCWGAVTQGCAEELKSRQVQEGRHLQANDKFPCFGKCGALNTWGLGAVVSSCPMPILESSQSHKTAQKYLIL